MNTEIATFGAGCFWGIEEAFRQVKGVVDTKVGYFGGRLDNPTYQDVCNDSTGHAEVVQVVFDTTVLSYDELLNVFWRIHDPTQINRQGPDVGSQYRTVIFYHNSRQEKTARESILKLNEAGVYRKQLATQVVPAAQFYSAEEYHQRYLEKRGLSQCHI